MREVQEAVYDDLIWKDSQEKVDASEEFEFTVDGETYHLDLTAPNLQQVEDLFGPLKEAATKVPNKRRKASTSTGGTTPRKPGGTSRKPTAEEKRENDNIREWARKPKDQGGGGYTDLPDKGRISQEVRDAYYAAQTGQKSGQVSEDSLTDGAPPQPAGQPQFTTETV